VHRDVKPSNLFLHEADDGTVTLKVCDFGIAKQLMKDGVSDTSTELTRTGGLLGSPLYMSPEQARSEPTDHRTDLFSLGGVLYTLCTGGPPFRADTTAAVLKRVREDAPRPIREVNPATPGWLCDLIGKLLAKEECDRPASAQAVADLLGGRLALLQQPPRTPLAGPSGRGRLLLACLVVLLVGLAA